MKFGKIFNESGLFASGLFINKTLVQEFDMMNDTNGIMGISGRYLKRANVRSRWYEEYLGEPFPPRYEEKNQFAVHRQIHFKNGGVNIGYYGLGTHDRRGKYVDI